MARPASVVNTTTYVVLPGGQLFSYNSQYSHVLALAHTKDGKNVFTFFYFGHVFTIFDVFYFFSVFYL